MSATLRERTVDRLRVRVAPDAATLGAAAAAHAAAVLRDAVDTRGIAHAMFATGNSQFAFLDALVAEFHFVEGDAPDLGAECARYAALLVAHPLELCCLGIGENGHLAFNDPPVADFADPLDVKVVQLDDACRRQQVGEGHFPDVDAVPTRAITVTIPALLRASAVLAIVPEARKRGPVERALTGAIDTACPASILREQAQATLYLDLESSDFPSLRA